jgi:uncharacterized membrane protein
MEQYVWSHNLMQLLTVSVLALSTSVLFVEPHIDIKKIIPKLYGYSLRLKFIVISILFIP